MNQIEASPSLFEPTTNISQQLLLNRITNRIRESLELPEILSATVAEVRAYLGTDRVKIYQFYPDGHGVVIAEAINEQNLPSLKGLHFPADDIPTYVRQHYVSARQRTVVDVSRSVVGRSNLASTPTVGEPTSPDLEFRQIDPCHLEYLQAMGVASSVVVPIIIEKNDTSDLDAAAVRPLDRLWGLLVSHHAQPREVSLAELDFIQSVVDRVSIAISQAKLLEQVREQARREANVNRVTSLLYTTATVQLQEALAETVAIYEGCGGRLYLSPVEGQSTAQLYTCGEQPSDLPGANQRSLEEHALWQNFLESTLPKNQLADRATPWSVAWMKARYTPEAHPETYLDEHHVWAIADIYQESLFRSIVPRFQNTNIRGVAICPLHYGDRAIGCITIFREEVDRETIWAGYHIPDERQMTPRQSFDAWKQIAKGCAQEWTQAEIRLIASLSERFAVAIKQYLLNQQVQALNTNLERQVEIRTRELQHSNRIANQQRSLAGILAKLQKPLDMRTLFRTATQEMQQILNVDRVAVYRFDADWGGEFIDEFGAVSPGWAKIILASRRQWNDSYLQSTQGGRYQYNEISVVNDIYKANLSPCHIEVLENYYIGAFAIAPLFVGQKLWGLLAAYQHEKPRQWDDAEVTFISQLATHLGVALQQAASVDRVQSQTKTLAAIAKKQQALNTVITKIRESLDLDKIFKTTTLELRRLLNADRAIVYRFQADSNYQCGEVISEDIADGWTSALDTKIRDACFVNRCTMSSNVPHVFAIDDVNTADITPCHREMLQKLQIQSNLVVPLYNCETLYKCDRLWGLLCIQQCSAPRIWEPEDKEFMTEIATHLGVALQQTNLLTQAQTARENADAANVAKSKFLANMSHELRTPLNAILGLAQLMIRDSSMTAQQQQRLNIIGKSGEHLLSLINDVLEMSRIEAGHSTLANKVIHLPAFLKSLEDMLAVTATAKNLTLRFDISADLPAYILVDEAKLRQVLINLLGNALKFTQVGEVVLTSYITSVEPKTQETPPDLIHFVVTDTGPGIPANEIEHIFEAFAQASTNTQAHEGSGLGLSICRQFVHLMGGDILATSEVGVGSSFHFYIQAIPGEPADYQLPTAVQTHQQLAPHQPIPKILVVEDKEVNQKLMVDFLESVGFEVATANNGLEAIERWQDWQPDAILMDMRMPMMDGYTAAQEIKRLAGDPAPIIFALTANAFEEDRQLALAHGCDEFVRKPYQETELLDLIAKYLGVQYSDVNQESLPDRTSKLSILVAEDNVLNQSTIEDMLSYFGHSVTIVENGADAVAAVQATNYDLILLDFHMPQMNGAQATRQIRQLALDSQPIIVGASGTTEPEELEQCLAAGMNATLLKPFTLENLQSLFDSLPTLRTSDGEIDSQTDRNEIEPNPISPATLDRQYLESYHVMFGDRATAKIIDRIQKFLNLMPANIQAIQSAIATGDRTAIFKEAHRFKPMVSFIGGVDLSELCGLLEENARHSNSQDDEAIQSQLILESQRLQLALEREIEDLLTQKHSGKTLAMLN